MALLVLLLPTMAQAGPVQYVRDGQNGRVTRTQTANLLDEWAYDARGRASHGTFFQIRRLDLCAGGPRESA
jgi:hypothetical protein